jgi:hypothetical protein
VGDHAGIPGTVVVFSFLIAFAVYVSPHRSVPSTVGSSNPYPGNRFVPLTGFAVYFVQPTWVDPEVPAVRVGLRLESSGRNGSSSCRQGYLPHQRDGSMHWFTWSVESQLGRPPSKLAALASPKDSTVTTTPARGRNYVHAATGSNPVGHWLVGRGHGAVEDNPSPATASKHGK